MKKNHSAEMLKILALAAALITLVLTLAACGGGGSVTGTWRLESVSGRADADSLGATLKEMQEWGGSAKLIFEQGGKGRLVVSMWGMENESPFDYSVKGDVVTISGSPLRFSVSGNTLTLKEGGVTMVCKKR